MVVAHVARANARGGACSAVEIIARGTRWSPAALLLPELRRFAHELCTAMQRLLDWYVGPRAAAALGAALEAHAASASAAMGGVGAAIMGGAAVFALLHEPTADGSAWPLWTHFDGDVDVWLQVPQADEFPMRAVRAPWEAALAAADEGPWEGPMGEQCIGDGDCAEATAYRTADFRAAIERIYAYHGPRGRRVQLLLVSERLEHVAAHFDLACCATLSTFARGAWTTRSAHEAETRRGATHMTRPLPKLPDASVGSWGADALTQARRARLERAFKYAQRGIVLQTLECFDAVDLLAASLGDVRV
jgi:hypothetical protein